ncbi:MAG: cytochrome c family protein [Deltaproteobacteria bacterium]|nr:cytochrome c family protein [Deltaproteobacteria bacterium]
MANPVFSWYFSHRTALSGRLRRAVLFRRALWFRRLLQGWGWMVAACYWGFLIWAAPVLAAPPTAGPPSSASALFGQTPAKQGLPPAAGGVVLLAAGDLRGEIKPCGCAPTGQQGGLPRRLTMFQGQYGRPLMNLPDGPPDGPVLVDLGNNFPPPSDQGVLKAGLIQKMLRLYLPQAVLPGPNELAYGPAALDKHLPYLISNDSAGRRFAASRTLTRLVTPLKGPPRRVEIHIYGYLSPRLVFQEFDESFHLEPVDFLLKSLAKAPKTQPANPRPHPAAILLFRGEADELALLDQSGLFDLILSGNPSEDETRQITSRRVAEREYPQVATKGQAVTVITLPMRLFPPEAGLPIAGQPVSGKTVGGVGGDKPSAAKPGAKQGQGKGQAILEAAPSGSSIRLEWLGDGFADHPAAKLPYQDYDRQTARLFFARLDIQEKTKLTSPYLGAEGCGSCHPHQVQVWKTSRHGGAYKALEKVGKQFDPECVACHTAGYERGGFLSQDLTPHLAGVQCENCHGPGRRHSQNPSVKTGGLTKAPKEAVCGACHVGSHSPAFDLPTYWPKIAH